MTAARTDQELGDVAVTGTGAAATFHADELAWVTCCRTPQLDADALVSAARTDHVDAAAAVVTAARTDHVDVEDLVTGAVTAHDELEVAVTGVVGTSTPAWPTAGRLRSSGRGRSRTSGRCRPVAPVAVRPPAESGRRARTGARLIGYSSMCA